MAAGGCGGNGAVVLVVAVVALAVAFDEEDAVVVAGVDEARLPPEELIPLCPLSDMSDCCKNPSRRISTATFAFLALAPHVVMVGELIPSAPRRDDLIDRPTDVQNVQACFGIV
jgi:hypothetical protein